MIFVILILAIVSSAFTFPAINQTHVNTKQQDSYHQVSLGSTVVPHGEKTEIQKPQIINQKQIAEPIKKKVDTSPEVEANQVQSTSHQEKPKILQFHQQVSKASDSNSIVHLFHLEPFVSDIVFLSSFREPILLPFFSGSQIQPLSFVSVKQVRSINQNPVTATEEVTNPVIVPTIQPVEQRNISVDISTQKQVTPSIKPPKIPQPQLNIPLPNVDQIFGKPIFKIKKEVDTTKTQNVNGSSQIIHLNEKHKKEGEKVEEKQIIAEPNLLKPQVQIISIPQDTNKIHSHVKVNHPSEIKGKKGEHQVQENVPTQYDNVPLGLNEQKVQSKIITEGEEHPNDRIFNIKEEIQKLQKEVQQEVISPEPFTEQFSPYRPYQEGKKYNILK